MKDNTYTLENIPTILDCNQFYCYNTRNGKITIGTIVGKSAISNYQVYEIDGNEYKMEYGSFSEANKHIKLNCAMKCFMEYQDFVEDYSEYLARKVKRQKETKTKYTVHKVTFFCNVTKAKTSMYNLKAFDTKEEAIQYANKGLNKLLRMSNEYNGIFKELKNKMEKIETTHIEAFSFEQMMAKPSNLKEGDSLAKINYIQPIGAVYLIDVDDNYSTFVKEFKGDCEMDLMAVLSDGTLLMQRECRYLSYPMLINESLKQKAKERCKYTNVKKLIYEIDIQLKDLKELKQYAESYKPFEKTDKRYGKYFSKEHADKLIEDIKYALNLYKNEN